MNQLDFVLGELPPLMRQRLRGTDRRARPAAAKALMQVLRRSVPSMLLGVRRYENRSFPLTGPGSHRLVATVSKVVWGIGCQFKQVWKDRATGKIQRSLLELASHWRSGDQIFYC